LQGGGHQRQAQGRDKRLSHCVDPFVFIGVLLWSISGVLPEGISLIARSATAKQYVNGLDLPIGHTIQPAMPRYFEL
jgi:hypothetical protein